jgi:hypothetical protein
LILSAGQSANYPSGVTDNTHFQEKGAVEISKLVYAGIEALDLPLIDTDPGGQTCQNWGATNAQHVSAGRAYAQTGSGCEAATTYYAVGSNANLGTSASTTTTLYTTDGQTYYQGSCPATGSDADGDGYSSDVDCNDRDAASIPVRRNMR